VIVAAFASWSSEYPTSVAHVFTSTNASPRSPANRSAAESSPLNSVSPASQWSNAHLPMFSAAEGINTSRRRTQFSNADSPIVSSASGNTAYSSDSQEKNARSPIFRSAAPNDARDRLLQP